MEILFKIALVMVAAWLIWKTMSLGLRLIGWALIALAITQADKTSPITTAVTASAGVIALVVGHAVFFVRHGHWKPRLMDRFNPRDDVGFDFEPHSRHHRH